MTNKFKVTKYSYNGFMGTHNPKKIMKYTALFKHWTPDPGIANCECSDGRIRLIPSYALKRIPRVKYDLPVQEKTGVIFGTPSSSR